VPYRDVIGHRRVLDLLARSTGQGTLPPSLIFTGPSGVGKLLTATAVAQALNCLQPRVPFDACGVCAACSRIARNVHPDVLLIQPRDPSGKDSGAIKVDQIRDLLDRVAYRPFEGKRRVVIIDDADALVPAAQNALLKTLEEPPSASAFILITSRPGLLLPTVRSRCPELRFRPLAARDIVAALVVRGRSEHDARLIAATAEGSLGRALEDGGGAYADAREVARQVLAQVAGRGEAGRRLGAAKELLTNTGAGGAGDREQLSTHLRAMASLVRDVELLASNADPRLDEALANPDLKPALENLVPSFRGERGVQAFAAIDQALAALDRNSGVKVVADWLVLQL
jgi:DNA polymerase III subunit delta'